MALKGIKVIEMAGLAPVPYCGLILSDFGARVIRIDRPKAPNIDTMGRGKQSITLNLKKKEAVDIVKRLCQTADVLIEPFRPGVMEKLGLGPDVLTTSNPKLIYARLTGYGQTGAMALKAGHDINYISMSGVLAKMGRKHERPYPPINLAADFGGGGLMCALGIAMALYERSTSGKGQIIDANMVEGSAYLNCWVDSMKNFFFQGERGTNTLDGGAAYYDTYETKDGKFMAVGALEPKFYADLVTGLGLKDCAQSDDQEKQRELFALTFKTKTRDEWVEAFKDLDACVTPVLSADEAAAHEHNKSKGSFFDGSGVQLQSAPAPRLNRTPEIRTFQPLPKIGQHTIEILSELGYPQSDIDNLIKTGVIGKESKL